MDPLTVLIGTNASGKSNVVDALDFLNSIMQGTSVEAVLTGDRLTPGIRGGVEWAVRKPGTKFSFQVLVDGKDEAADYLYKITIETQPTIQVIDESLTLIDSQKLSDSNSFQQLSFISFNLGKNGQIYLKISKKEKEYIEKFYPTSNPWLGRSTTQTPFYEFDNVHQMMLAESIVPNILKNIFILNPITSQMRDYSPLSKKLERDGSNIAGVLAALPEKQKTEVEEYLLKYLAKLPEGGMRKVWAETVGRLDSDAMLYCE
ncbi:AAA family ATPase [Okeania sp. SIO2G4]|uniref:AAA family ATPase n=1 Tax=unclassified Okeania TaxID=2634635 RepID=UPI0035C90FC5